MVNPGVEGERVVAQWLEEQGAEILHRRWRCPWGELDLIARWDDIVVFVEVKTRSPKNWDENGLLAISVQKQERLRNAAEYFLAQVPELAECPCRFDVALVHYWPQSTDSTSSFTILDYLQEAF